jgi:hypothetical protein
MVVSLQIPKLHNTNLIVPVPTDAEAAGHHIFSTTLKASRVLIISIALSASSIGITWV